MFSQCIGASLIKANISAKYGAAVTKRCVYVCSYFILSVSRCLHSLSRSVQQLRTSFHDHAVWKPLMKVSGVWRKFCLDTAALWMCAAVCVCKVAVNKRIMTIVVSCCVAVAERSRWSPGHGLLYTMQSTAGVLTQQRGTHSHTLKQTQQITDFIPGILRAFCSCSSAAHPGVRSYWVTMQSDPEWQSCTEGQWDLGPDGKKICFSTCRLLTPKARVVRGYP